MSAVTGGPGLRWAFMGTFMAWHLGGGPGGMRHTFKQFGPALELPWSHMKAPELTEELKTRIVNGCEPNPVIGIFRNWSGGATGAFGPRSRKSGEKLVSARGRRLARDELTNDGEVRGFELVRRTSNDREINMQINTEVVVTCAGTGAGTQWESTPSAGDTRTDC
ncbi:MAG: hypothetical protein CM1200mP20_09130 [Pseudomonadota bacterium]|nr:MAG: hypothetical protein CM1200mP20_09130 [Pseudomonadota bacterium]